MHIAPVPSHHLRRVSTFATVLAFGVVVLGAYVRLTDAGLGCPDWPGCYGRAVPGAEAVDAGKAWREMIHRYAAGTLGLAVGLIVVSTWRRRRAGSPLLVPSLLALVIVLQALLGMWTVTLLLEPVIVMAHLLGGLTTLALLTWLALGPRPGGGRPSVSSGERALVWVGLAVLGGQIILGGWTSANYAATACPDVPECRAEWWPPADYVGGFVSPPDVEAGRLDLPAKTAIHLAHRLGAVATVLVLGAVAVSLTRRRHPTGVRRAGAAVAAGLVVQAGLGIAMILTSFSLPVAVAHNAGAALLLVAVVAAVHTLGRPDAGAHHAAAELGPTVRSGLGIG